MINPHNPVLQCAVAMQSNVTPIAWGPPGIGKTAVTEAIAKVLGLGFVSVSAAFLAPEDMLGIPMPTGLGGMVRGLDAHFERAINTPVLFLIDEMNRGTPPVMNACMRFINERYCGAQPLHAGTRIMATCNAVTSGGTRELSEALANRVCHIKWEYDSEAFLSYLMGGPGIMGNLPSLPDMPTIEAGIPAMQALLASFLRRKPEHGHSEPNGDAMSNEPWGRKACGPWTSPRTLTMYARCLSTVSAMGDIRSAGYADLAHNLGCGLLGTGVAGEFYQFIAHSDLRSGAEVLDDPNYTPRPGRIDLLWAEAMAAALECNRRRTPAALDAMVRVFTIIKGNPEVVTICAPYVLGLNTGASPEAKQAATVFIPLLSKYPALVSALRDIDVLTAAYGVGGAAR